MIIAGFQADRQKHWISNDGEDGLDARTRTRAPEQRHHCSGQQVSVFPLPCYTGLRVTLLLYVYYDYIG